MIIVSQDKDAIINFNNIANLVAIENNIVSICNIEETTGITIAEYKTQERAKEVLQEIVKTYVLTEQYKVEDERTRIKLMMEGILLYEMPKE